MSSYGFGATVRLTMTVKGSDGSLTDPDTITMTILKPDLTLAGPFDSSTTPAVVRESLGSYSLSYVTDQVGPHIARWVTTLPGSNDEQPFDVEPVWGDAGIISLLDAKNHMKKSKILTDDDEKLQGIILGATDMIQDRCGQVVPTRIIEDHYDVGRVLVLRKRPVISVVSITKYPGATLIAAKSLPDSRSGWELTSVEGVVETTSRFLGDMRVEYIAGRSPIPHRFRLATKELVAHLWRTSQLNQEGGRPPLQGDVQVADRGDFALPYNVRQLLGLNKNQTDMPTVG